MLALSFANSIMPQDESQRRRDAVLTGGLTSAKQRQDDLSEPLNSRAVTETVTRRRDCGGCNGLIRVY